MSSKLHEHYRKRINSSIRNKLGFNKGFRKNSFELRYTSRNKMGQKSMCTNVLADNRDILQILGLIAPSSKCHASIPDLQIEDLIFTTPFSTLRKLKLPSTMFLMTLFLKNRKFIGGKLCKTLLSSSYYIVLICF